MAIAGEEAATAVTFEPTAGDAKAATYDPLMVDAEEQAAAIARIHAEADAFFEAIDVNDDGTIETEELRMHLSQIGYAEVAVDSIFNLLDVNSDGGISKLELREAFVKYEDPALRLALGLGTSAADAIFDRIDVNGDGELTKEELVSYLESGGYPLTSGVAETIFATLDTNSNGSVSREELRDGYVRYSALREALGLEKKTVGVNVKNGKSPKGQPKRWGRGRSKGVALSTVPQPPDGLLTTAQAERLQPLKELARKRASPKLR